MPRIYIPDIKDTIVNELTTIESALAWMKRLQVAEVRLEAELQQIKMVLKYVVIPKFNQLNKEKMQSETRI